MPEWAEVAKAALPAVCGLIGAGIGAWASRRSSYDTKVSSLQAQIMKISEFGMQWPLLESDDYCKKYPGGDSIERERYENYCVYVFNVIAGVWKLSKNRHELASQMLDIDELVERHYRCWQGERGNLGYHQDFRNYINGRIDQLKRDGKIAT